MLILIEEEVWLTKLAGPGFLPLLQEALSDDTGVWAVGPLAPRVVRVPHDDDRRILYRSLDGFWDDLLIALDHDQDEEDGYFRAESFFREVVGDYSPDAARTAEDRAAARMLMTLASDDSRGNGFKLARLLAIQLLDVSCCDEWAALLGSLDPNVRKAALSRLKPMNDPETDGLLARDRLAGAETAALLAEAAGVVGLDVIKRQAEMLWISDHLYDLDYFIPRRQIDNALPR